MASVLHLLVVLVLFQMEEPSKASPGLHRWWPAFPAPKRILKSVPFHGLPVEERFLLQALAGLSTQAVQERRTDAMIWISLPGSEPYEEWFRRMAATVRPKVDSKAHDVWELTRWLQGMGMIRGYVLYRLDTFERPVHEKGRMDVAANVATSLCGILKAIPITESLQAKAESLGLRMLEDVRDKSEEWCLERYQDRFSRLVIGMNDPKNPQTREMAIAAKAFVCSQADRTLEKALERVLPDIPVLGWGVGDEMELTMSTTRYAAFQTATNWCVNLHILSEPLKGPFLPESHLRRRRDQIKMLRDLKWEDDVHYVSYLLTDGDNVQWLMGNFLNGPEGPSYWGNPERGKAPFGWTFPLADLRQLCPYTLDMLFSTATPNDGLVLMSGGYYYPDAFGQTRGGKEALALHARRISAYMRRAGISLISGNFQRWNSPQAIQACETYARNIPDLLGIMGFQYYPYSGGNGTVHWVKNKRGEDVPAVAARFAIWNHVSREREGTPLKIARLVGEMPHTGPVASEDRFSWVIVHCWSWFQRAAPGSPPEMEEVEQKPSSDPNIQRGYSPAMWSIQALPPHVLAVTPEELFLQLRLRLRPQQTLKAYLCSIEGSVERLKQTSISPSARKKLIQARLLATRARRLLASGLKTPMEQRQCFELCQQADREVLGGKRMQRLETTPRKTLKTP